MLKPEACPSACSWSWRHHREWVRQVGSHRRSDYYSTYCSSLQEWLHCNRKIWSPTQISLFASSQKTAFRFWNWTCFCVVLGPKCVARSVMAPYKAIHWILRSKRGICWNERWRIASHIPWWTFNHFFHQENSSKRKGLVARPGGGIDDIIDTVAEFFFYRWSARVLRWSWWGSVVEHQVFEWRVTEQSTLPFPHSTLLVLMEHTHKLYIL